MIHLLLIILLIQESAQKHLNIKGPVHQDLATTCLMKILDNSFKPRKLITFLQEPTLDNPGYDIQNRLIKEMNFQLNWTFEQTNGIRNNFESFSVCLNCKNNTKKKVYKNYFQTLMKTAYYVIVLEKMETLVYLMEKIITMKPYRTRALYLIYYYPLKKSFRNIALDIFEIMYKYKHYNALVVIPSKADRFHLYGYDLYSEKTEICATTPEMVLINYCDNGTFLSNKLSLRTKYDNLRNCTVNAIAMRLPPFVISESEGLEINILQALGEKLNITFNITISDRAGDWGTKHNDSWDGLLKDIKASPFLLGVGCISLNQDRIDDFDSTLDYFVERMVWILPAAIQVPQWKVIIVIFEDELWIGIISVFISFGLIFFVMSYNHPYEMRFIKDFGASMLLSLQSIIGAPATNHPKTKSMRIMFINLNIFGMVVGCVYQSCLVDVLTNSRYEYQMQTEGEILDSHYKIGGILAYRQNFNETSDNHSNEIFRKYQVTDEANDTMYYWLRKVAKDRDIVTVLGKYYVDYLISKGDPGIVNHDGRPKVFIVEEILLHYPIRLIFPKSFPLRNVFNSIISGLLHSGLVNKWSREYLFLKKEKNSDDDDEEHYSDQKGVKVISIDHLQGAFSMLMIGCAISGVVFLGEIMVNKNKKHWKHVILKVCAMFRRKMNLENNKSSTNGKGSNARGRGRRVGNFGTSQNIYKNKNIFQRLFLNVSKICVGFKNKFSRGNSGPEVIVRTRRKVSSNAVAQGETYVVPSRRITLNRTEKGKFVKRRK